MKRFVCQVCGYVFEGDEAPDFCPQCKAPKSKFTEQVIGGDIPFADEHKVGSAQGLDAKVVEELRANGMGECTEVGM